MALILEIRRHRKLIKQYRGLQPADRMLKEDVGAAFRALVGGADYDIQWMLRRMKGNLPPVKSKDTKPRTTSK